MVVAAAQPAASARPGWAGRLLVLLTAATLVTWYLTRGMPASSRARLTAMLPLQSGPAKVRVGWSLDLLADGVRPPSGLTFKEAVPICTDNSGNLVWAYAARKLLDPNATEFVPIIRPYSEPIRALLMPQANLLMNASRYHLVKSYTAYLISMAKKVEAPIMLVGIGSQVRFEAVRQADAAAAKGGEADGGGSTFDASGVVLDPQQVEFMRLVEDSGGMTTVRGKFTAAVMARNQLQPPLVLGCPSFFLNHNPALGQVLQQKRDALLAARDPKARICVNLPNIPGDKPYPDSLVELLAKRVIGAFPNSVVVLQTLHDENIMDKMHKKHGTYLRTHRLRFFYDVESWIQGLRSACDFMFGFRIHGTMAAVAAEVPGMLIAPDMRVQEMAEAMALPTTNMLDLATLELPTGKLDPESFDLYDFVESIRGYEGFDARRQQVARIYAAEFERLGVPSHPGLLNIASLADEEAEEE